MSERGTGSVPFSELFEAASRKLHGEQAAYPNGSLDNLHAEMNLMQKAYKDGLIQKGGTMEISVVGQKAVCLDCRHHLPIMAENLALRLMTVVDKKEGIVYYWKPGMRELEFLAKLPATKPNK